MAKPNKKLIREMLDLYTEAQGRVDSLKTQRDGALEPLKARYEKAAAKATRDYDSPIREAETAAAKLRSEIEAEIRKGFDAKANSYSVTKVDAELAFVEVKSTSQREVPAEQWLDAIKPNERETAFWETVKVQLGKAEKFRSDIVKKLAVKKTTHSIEVNLRTN
ncbi:MAG: hypothetical protein IPN69_08165 [Acidobacteria bacterium]|nr:hypothetical protein [Acidobacteriota bacterium]